ncbi:ABC transporter ATP-binding protein [Salinibacterium sp. M195]|uniref:ABC transporter ATP-binding protein n=1 Tax=Salinibacterium sp. M195 TaxID=2583374 RepID=UPI001C634361|nr:ABC transporter ATP-binding protein [Salinibacterium sp. M195]QYH35276.1 ABC transporter ATP-binding protein [Salinibacterium sp. M195]
MTAPLLKLENLTTEFTVDGGIVPAVNGASYEVMPGETLGVVGESGSGKSVAIASALGLLPSNGRVVDGHAWFDGRDLVTMSDRERNQILGKEIGLVFQDPMTALNPVMRVGDQISESLLRHDRSLGRRAAAARVVELLAEVGIPSPEQRARRYPHEFSGGMRQRAMIAMAIANRPRLIIADEPTTALDVTIQAQILDLLRKVQRENDAALVMITHDLGVIAELAQRVVVMYGGRVVESAEVDTLFHGSRHPYTRGLLDSLPRLGSRQHELLAIGGHPPDPRALPSGCPFEPRCPVGRGRDVCRDTRPELQPVGHAHASACHFTEELATTEGDQ